MRRIAGVLVLMMGLFEAASALGQQAGRAGIFASLSVGQVVSVDDRMGLLEVTVIEPNPQGVGSHRILEIGADHLVVEDLVHVTRSWIPVTAIRRVNSTRLGGDPAPPRK